MSDSGSDPSGTNQAPAITEDPTIRHRSCCELRPGTPTAAGRLDHEGRIRSHREIGDAVTYSIGIRNHLAPDLPAMFIEDLLPLGFSYIAGTARLTVGEATVPLSDPHGAGTQSLVFSIPAQPGASEAMLTYRVRVSAGAQQGDGTNRAVAIAADGTRSNEVHVRVLVRDGVFTQQACLIGKIFADGSGNRLQDSNEPGVAGVALYLEDGTSVSPPPGASAQACARTRTYEGRSEHSSPGATLVPAAPNALDAGSAFRCQVRRSASRRLRGRVRRTVRLRKPRCPHQPLNIRCSPLASSRDPRSRRLESGGDVGAETSSTRTATLLSIVQGRQGRGGRTGSDVPAGNRQTRLPGVLVV
jgi:uncharacterized repeat protein (TIGR01451 family)